MNRMHARLTFIDPGNAAAAAAAAAAGRGGGAAVASLASLQAGLVVRKTRHSNQ
ncbi:hypothetical protein PF003_g32937 [Phytophthora fragariae]|nr:hypothetical protein PF003_g32937 [Phytophthora fragariae]